MRCKLHVSTPPHVPHVCLRFLYLCTSAYQECACCRTPEAPWTSSWTLLPPLAPGRWVGRPLRPGGLGPACCGWWTRRSPGPGLERAWPPPGTGRRMPCWCKWVLNTSQAWESTCAVDLYCSLSMDFIFSAQQESAIWVSLNKFNYSLKQPEG